MRFMLKLSINQSTLLLVFLGISAFAIGLLWESTGATPCILCKLERWLFLSAGLCATLPLLTYRVVTKQRLTLFGTTIWCSLCVTFFRHYGIQMKWFSLPHACHFSLPQTDLLTLEKMLASRIQIQCDHMPFLFLGQPPTFYLFFLCAGAMLFSMWLFIRHEA